ncbi:unnamed protein product, partial [Adineta steineri]
MDYDMFALMIKQEITEKCFSQRITSHVNTQPLRNGYCIVRQVNGISDRTCLENRLSIYSDTTIDTSECSVIPVGECDHSADELACRCLRSEVITFDVIRFQEICNNLVHPTTLPNNNDETDCNEWHKACVSKYVHCNGVWECSSGVDELQCDGQLCPAMHLFCLNVHQNYIPVCLSMSNVNDGNVDCAGGIDERLMSPCPDRFYCHTGGGCVDVHDLCDNIVQCPLSDEDERMCPWRRNTRKC